MEKSDETSMMLISRAKKTYKAIDSKKTSTGSFYTKKEVWLTKPVQAFLKKALKNNNHVLDPFVGDGHLLNLCAEKYGSKLSGYDIKETAWQINDSLINIPNPLNAVIVTNPPYLANYSAKRKGVLESVKKYFELGREDLYQVALDRCIESANYTVAIIPETYLNSAMSKQYLSVLSVLEENPFDDTETPVCVACFDTTKTQDGSLYIADQFCGFYEDIFKFRQKVDRNKDVVFNDAAGRFALKAVDGTQAGDRIRFENAKNFGYARENIKVSSRLLTYFEVLSISDDEIDSFILECNHLLESHRANTFDLTLSPFKGNNKEGKRRRRLDYSLARNIIAESLLKMKKSSSSNRDLFSLDN